MSLPSPFSSSLDDSVISSNDTSTDSSSSQSVFGHHGDGSSGKKMFKANRGKFTSAKTKYFLGGLVLTMLMIVGGVAYNLTQKEGVGEIRQQASSSAVYTFPQTFDTGTVPQKGEWSPMSSSSDWGKEIGTNKGFYSRNLWLGYDNKATLELVANHASGNTSAYQISKSVPLSTNVTYTVQFPVYVTENSGGGDIEVLVQGQKADGNYEQPVREYVDTSRTRQWQVITKEFKFTNTTIASDKFFVTLIVWDHRSALFGEIKITKKADNSLVQNLDFSSIVNSALPSGWEFSQSNPGWTTPSVTWTHGNGVAIIQPDIVKSGKAIVLSSHQNRSNEPGAPSNLTQACLPLSLVPGRSYPLSVDVYIPHNTGSGNVGILIQEFNSPYGHLLNFNDKVNLGLKGQWQTLTKTIQVPATAPIGTPTSPNYKLCLQALNNRRVIFDNVNITGLVVPSDSPSPTASKTWILTAACADGSLVNNNDLRMFRIFFIGDGSALDCESKMFNPTSKSMTITSTVPNDSVYFGVEESKKDGQEVDCSEGIAYEPISIHPASDQVHFGKWFNPLTWMMKFDRDSLTEGSYTVKFDLPSEYCSSEESCATDSDCSSGQKCNPTTGECVTPVCAVATDCDDDNECTIELCSHPGAYNASCSNSNKPDDTACTDGTCQAGVCTPEESCATDSDCSSGQKCNPTTGECVTPVCAVATDCDDDNECTIELCSHPGAYNASCSNSNKPDDTACTDGTCQAGVCTADEDETTTTSLSLTASLDGVPYCEGTSCFHPVLHDATKTTGPGKQVPVQVTLQNTISSAITKTVWFSYDETQQIYETSEPIEYENLIDSPYMIMLKGPMHLATRYCYYNQAVTNRCTFSDLVNAGSIKTQAQAEAAKFIWLGEGEYSYNLSGKSVAVGDLPISGEGDNEQDGKVNIADYSFMLGCIGQNSRTSACVTRADVDYSNQVNNIDLGLLRKTLKEVIDEL